MNEPSASVAIQPDSVSSPPAADMDNSSYSTNEKSSMAVHTVHVIAEADGIVLDPPAAGEELCVLVHSNPGYTCLLYI